MPLDKPRCPAQLQAYETNPAANFAANLRLVIVRVYDRAIHLLDALEA
jgi:hypothetical protein